jgi:hypothetical protein
MKTSGITFLSQAEKLTCKIYNLPRHYSILDPEFVGRLAAVVLLSPAAALDLCFHSLLTLPTFTYAIGKSIYQSKLDLTLPWQHIQRMRNSVAPLVFGSTFGFVNPLAGVALSEPTDKHVIVGMLGSNTEQNLDTPCSPIHSFSIVESIAKYYKYAISKGLKKEIFPEDYVEILKGAKNIEKSLESLQAQEFLHKITNITLLVMVKIVQSIENSGISMFSKQLLIRSSFLLVPILTLVDAAISLIVESFF